MEMRSDESRCAKNWVKRRQTRLTSERLLNLPAGRVLALGDILDQKRERERVVVRKFGGLVVLGVEEILGGREEADKGLGDIAWEVGWMTRSSQGRMLISGEQTCTRSLADLSALDDSGEA